MLKVGLTGGIGSGKSTANQIFESFGIPVIDADILARQLVKPGKPALQAVITQFGPGILDASNGLDRAKLRNIVFSDSQARKVLENILHPLVENEMKQQVAALKVPYCILTIPLLIESGLFKWLDRILVIDVQEEIQFQRIQQRDNTLSSDLIQSIINTQISRQQRLLQANDIVNNDGDTDQLKTQLSKLHQQYLQMADC